MPVQEEVFDEEFVESRLSLEFPNGEDGEPVITIGKEVLTAMNSLWKRCMIVRVLGRNVPILSLRRGRVHGCSIRGSMEAFGSYLMVQAWSPDFDPLKDEIVTTPVWVHLSHIPVNFYHKTILMEVNLNKPLKGSVMVNGERYYVSYEGISAICSMCGMFGHLVNSCPRNVTERALGTVPSPVTMTHVGSESTGMDTEFTQVRQARRKLEQQRSIGGLMRSNEERSVGGRKTREVRKEGVLEEIRVSNRFGGLEEEGETDELAEVGVREEGNKENENTVNLSLGGSSKVHGKAMTFVANEKKEKHASVRLGPKEKKTSNMRSPHFQMPKSKPVGPTRGLVYGPTKEEIDMSVSGKRLRVEKETVSRPGGAFAGVRDVEGKERNPDHAGEQSNMQAPLGQDPVPLVLIAWVPLKLELILNLGEDRLFRVRPESSSSFSYLLDMMRSEL
ncbi:hypothetical protein Bca4012_073837 [Brassica carinata]